MPALFVALLLSAPGSGRVAAHADGCAPGFQAELRRLLTIELRAPVVDAAGPGDSTVDVQCAGARYELTLTAPQRGQVTRSIDTTELDPLALPRAVTLVIAEGLAALWQTTATPEAPAPVAPPPPPPAVVELPPRFTLSAFGGARLAHLPLFGGGLALEVALLRWLGVHLELAAARGAVTRTLGAVQATLLDGSAAMELRTGGERWLLRGGVGLRVGAATLAGLPATASTRSDTVTGLLWGPQLSVGGAWFPWRWLSLGLGVDGGVWAPRVEGVVVDEAPVRLDGLFASVWAAMGVRW